MSVKQEADTGGNSSTTNTGGDQSEHSKTVSIGELSDSEFSRLLTEDKINNFFKTLEPFVHQVDEHVIAVRTSQQLLNQQLNQLLHVINQIKDEQQQQQQLMGGDPNIIYAKSQALIGGDIWANLEDQSRRLLGLKRRLTLVHSILQTVNSRTKKLLLAHNSRIITARKAT